MNRTPDSHHWLECPVNFIDNFRRFAPFVEAKDATGRDVTCYAYVVERGKPRDGRRQCAIRLIEVEERVTRHGCSMTAFQREAGHLNARQLTKWLSQLDPVTRFQLFDVPTPKGVPNKVLWETIPGTVTDVPPLDGTWR